MAEWKRGDIAQHTGDIPESTARLEPGSTYVVNAVGRAHNATYLQIVDDNREVHDLLASHFAKTAFAANKGGD